MDLINFCFVCRENRVGAAGPNPHIKKMKEKNVKRVQFFIFFYFCARERVKRAHVFHPRFSWGATSPSFSCFFFAFRIFFPNAYASDSEQ